MRESKVENNLSEKEGTFMNSLLDAKILQVIGFADVAKKIIKDVNLITEQT